MRIRPSENQKAYICLALLWLCFGGICWAYVGSVPNWQNDVMVFCLFAAVIIVTYQIIKWTRQN